MNNVKVLWFVHQNLVIILAWFAGMFECCFFVALPNSDYVSSSRKSVKMHPQSARALLRFFISRDM